MPRLIRCELDNLIWQNGVPGIIDFDVSAHHWYAADISFALRDLFDYGITTADPRAQAFIDGYREHSPIDDRMLSHLPSALAGNASPATAALSEPSTSTPLAPSSPGSVTSNPASPP